MFIKVYFVKIGANFVGSTDIRSAPNNSKLYTGIAIPSKLAFINTVLVIKVLLL